jgi:hypothetical protein
MRCRLNILLLAACAVVVMSSLAWARRDTTDNRVPTSTWSNVVSRDHPAALQPIRSMWASAAVTTLVLGSYTFEVGASCVSQGWTTVDRTAQTGDWWHVDAFAGTPWAGTQSTGGVTFSPIQGSKSMWMAATPPPAGPINTTLCGYASLPGYGNGWNQSLCSKDCMTTSGGATPNLDAAFKLKFDTEPGYDAVELEYTTDCSGSTGWSYVDGPWSGAGQAHAHAPYAVGAGPVRIRIHFTSDASWSNQDGFYNGFGVAIDSLCWETKPVEDFEGEAVGVHASEDWTSCVEPGFGDYLALFKKSTGANYEEQCLDNLGCYWAAIFGSTEFYYCGSPPQPSQQVVPHANVRGQSIWNEIWSPVIPFSGSGAEFHLRYTVYRDLPLDNLVFHVWHARMIDASGCPGVWKDDHVAYYGASKNWAIVDQSIGPLLDSSQAVSFQVALGVIDLCPKWCGVLGTGLCHSPAPYFDSVKVLRVNTLGPQWNVRAVDTYQDTFPNDGTITGVARIDAALDIEPASSLSYTPGDSAVVLYVADPSFAGTGYSPGLLDDPNTSSFVGRDKTKKQVYAYFTVTPFRTAKIGPAISDGPGGQANRYPYMGTVSASGKTWAKVRMDYTYAGTSSNPGDGHPAPNAPPLVANRFNVDINDALFTAGDTISYFFGATSVNGTTYYSTEFGPASDINAVASNAMEITILPAGGVHRGGGVLYVDGADGLNVEPYYYGAFSTPSSLRPQYVDRYDVRDPSAASANRLAAHVYNVTAQLKNCYRTILWDCGALSVTLGDGSGTPLKTDDYALMNAYLSGNPQHHGLFLAGDRVAEFLNGYTGSSAITFRNTYMPFTLINNNHRLPPTGYAISPKIMPWPGRFYTDSSVLFGGCPELNDFDVIGASGSSQVQMSYNTASNPNGAVLRHVSGNGYVVMAGFSFSFVRDDELDGISDRTLFLKNTELALANTVIDAVGPSLSNRLSQNYPNPFNPQTTISFSLKQRGLVSLKVYDVSGALVRALVENVRPAGSSSVTWDGRDMKGALVGSGVYFYRLVAPGFTQTKKMVLLK